MAVIDYGAVVFKNGKKINGDDLFMDMLEAVGWVDVPRARYPDCDCTDERGYSDCDKCPRRTVGHYEDIDGKMCDYTAGDCHGIRIVCSYKLDGNYYAYAGDDDLTFCFYKTQLLAVRDKNELYSVYKTGKDGSISVEHNFGGLKFKVRSIWNRRVYHFSTIYKGDSYHVIYGYGIDPDMRVWNKAKNEYLGKKLARKVDNLYRRIEGSK